jgi:membrane protease YdiL (CAAX protease family)
MVSQKPWRLELFLRMLLRLFVCFAAGMVSVSFLRHWLGDRVVESSLLNVIATTMCFQGAVLVLVAIFLREHGIDWAEAFGFKNEPAWALMLGVCVAIIGLPVCWWLQSHSVSLLTQFGFNVDEQDPVRLLRQADALWKQVYLAVFAIVLAPVAEELLFRGIAYPLLKKITRPRFALWSMAMFFALIHGNLAVIVPLTFLAVVLTLLYEWTNNLLACIVVHSLFNAANFVMLFVLKNSGQLPGSP